MTHDLDNEALRLAFTDLGNTLAMLQPRASAQALASEPDPREVANILWALIVSLRGLFPATGEAWRSIGEIARDEVIPQLLEKMGQPSDHNSTS